MKKFLPVFLIVLLLIVGGVFFFLNRKKTPSVPVEGPTTVLPIEERPFVQLSLDSEAHNLKLQILGIRQASTIEYELIYFANEYQKGVIGSGQVEGGSRFSKDLLLGSCSRNVCRYDENVTGGNLTLKLRGSGTTQKYVIPFSVYEGTGKAQTLMLKEGNFSFEGTLTKGNFYLLGSTVGLPEMPEGKIIGGPVGISAATEAKDSGKVQISLSQEASNVQVLAWDNNSSSWEQLTDGLKINSQKVEISAPNLTAFVVVTP